MRRRLGAGETALRHDRMGGVIGAGNHCRGSTVPGEGPHGKLAARAQTPHSYSPPHLRCRPSLGAPSALADPNTIACEPGQIVIDNQCSAPPNKTAAGNDSNGGDHNGDSSYIH